jgi:hypothetical protein
MSNFKLSDFSIQNETKESAEVRVVKLDTGPAPQVTSFALQELRIKGKGVYSAVKAKYGALAATDEDRRTKGRDRRFSVNPLLRDGLAIEDEERRVIDIKIEEQVVLLREQASIDGAKKGFEEGLKKGREEGFAQFQADSAGALTTDPEYVVRLARDLMDRVGVRDNVKIRIGQKDAASIDLLKADLTKTFSDLKNLSIEVSEEIQDGGCVIETQWSAIDASIETQLKGLQEALVGTSPDAALAATPAAASDASSSGSPGSSGGTNVG